MKLAATLSLFLILSLSFSISDFKKSHIAASLDAQMKHKQKHKKYFKLPPLTSGIEDQIKQVDDEGQTVGEEFGALLVRATKDCGQV